MLDKADWIHLNQSIVAATVSNFRPDILIADSFPYGEYNELFPAMATVPRKILIYDYYPRLKLAGTQQNPISNYDLVIIPYEEGQIPAPVALNATLEWVGPMIYRGREEALPRKEARRRLGIAENQLWFYVTLGGGGGAETGETINWLSEIARSFPRLMFLQTVPPLASGESGILKAENVRSISHFPLPFAPYLSAFDGAIAAAGVNTSLELINFGVPAVWLPMGSQESADQKGRAQKLAAEGLGWAVDRLDSEGLGQAIRNMLSADVRRAMRKKMLAQPTPLGAKKGAEITCKWLRQSE